MEWSPTSPLIQLTTDLLHLQLRAERLQLLGKVQEAGAQARALGLPEESVQALLRRKPPAAPSGDQVLEHLEVQSSGDF